MFEDRDLRIDLVAFALAVFGLFLACALFTYDPADRPIELVYPLNLVYQPDALVHPLNPQTHNIVGPWGALVADVLLRSLGWGAFYFLLALAVVTALLFARRHIRGPIVRTVGWIFSLFGLTSLLTMFLPALSLGPVIGSGGHLGAMGRAFLESHFAAFGGFMFAAAIFVAGLLLCTDYVLVHLLVLVGAASADRVVHGTKRIASKTRRSGRFSKKGVGSEEDDSLSIRIRGKKVGSLTDDLVNVEEEIEGFTEGNEDSEYEEDGLENEEALENELDQEDDFDADEEDDEVAELKPTARRGGRRRRLVPALRVRQPPEDEEREDVMQRLDEASRTEDEMDYELPDPDLLAEPDDFCVDEQEREVRRKAKILEKAFASFGYQVKVVDVETGPVIAQYEVKLEAGLRLSKITGLADDVAIALRVPSVRIVAPIPGKNTVGIEVPNEKRQVVRLREVMDETHGGYKKMRIPLFLGKDVSGSPITVDLSTLPHLLIAGRTGTGKSVCLNAIISSILMTRRPDEVRMLMVDPKMVELSGYRSLPHLMHPVVTDMRKAEAILAWAVEKMEERYELLASAGVRHISGYNQLSEEELMERLDPESEEQRKAIPLHMPYIVIVADEMADLMMTAGKEVEQHIIRLAQKSRAVGIHLILATQKPTVDVITGLIKSNLPARIAFQVASRTDSRVVLDEMGADKLLGSGDMLFLWPGTSNLLRGQGTYLEDEEINGIVDSVSTGEQQFLKELVHLKVEDSDQEGPGRLKNRDELYEEAVDVVVREGRGSVSLLQRALGIGYGRAARLIDFMAEDGIVGAYAGSQAREVLISPEDWRAMKSGSAETEPSAPPRKIKKLTHNSSELSDQSTSPVTEFRKSKSTLIKERHEGVSATDDDTEYEDDDVDALEEDEMIDSEHLDEGEEDEESDAQDYDDEQDNDEQDEDEEGYDEEDYDVTEEEYEEDDEKYEFDEADEEYDESAFEDETPEEEFEKYESESA